MAFGDIYCNILLPFVESYKLATNQKNRAVIIKNAAEAVVKSRHLLEDTGIDLPKDLNTVRPLLFCIYLSPVLLMSSGYHSLHKRTLREGYYCQGWGS